MDDLQQTSTKCMCKHQQYILEVISEQSHQRGHLQLKIIKQFDTSTYLSKFCGLITSPVTQVKKQQQKT